ncbi:MAG TPA: hydroxymethylglutaryl-CoA synthase, partial [Methanomassiliicoccaceae archaeon]|nr:hydroxymethylglutaryl-CoA synthase [Methanomassiliicoccaceae archaeon]
LDVAKPGQRIFAVAYGSGAGSDAFDISVTDGIEELDRSAAPSIRELVERKKFIDYATYAKYKNKIKLKEAIE